MLLEKAYRYSFWIFFQSFLFNFVATNSCLANLTFVGIWYNTCIHSLNYLLIQVYTVNVNILYVFFFNNLNLYLLKIHLIILKSIKTGIFHFELCMKTLKYRIIRRTFWIALNTRWSRDNYCYIKLFLIF